MPGACEEELAQLLLLPQPSYYLFGVILGEKLLRLVDNLSRYFQHKHLSAAEGQSAAHLTVDTLSTLRNDAEYDMFWEDKLPITAAIPLTLADISVSLLAISEISSRLFCNTAKFIRTLP